MEKMAQTLLMRRKELGITQQQLADLVGIGINTLVSIERGTGNPSLGTLGRVADALGLELQLIPKRIY